MTDTNSPGKSIETRAEPAPDAFASETERQVAQIFAEILELQWVAPEDDIFALGGELVRGGAHRA